jgi:hypothetical protein
MMTLIAAITSLMKAIRINLLNQKKMKESLQKNISIKQ